MKYANMNVAELKDLCKERNIVLKGARSKTALISKLEAADNLAKLEGANSATKSEQSYAVNAMKTALVVAHQNNNSHAITKQEAMCGGATEERFDQWVLWVDDLRNRCAEYVKVKHQFDATPQEIARRYGAIFPAWRSILKVGEESVLAPKMFVREDDVVSLVGFCEVFVGTAVGTQMSVQSKLTFRKLVESLLGCRMAANAILTDDERDDIKSYESAKRTVKKCIERLNGKEDKEGRLVPGLIGNIVMMESTISELETMFAGKLTTEELEKVLKSPKEKLDQLKKDKDSAESTKKDAEETIERLKDRIEALYATINTGLDI